MPTLELPQYLTAGGAIIALVRTEDGRTTATCGGCHDSATYSAVVWAENHAHNCRVIPRATWPQGVLARATTYGGAHIDLTIEGSSYFTACSGCTSNKLHAFTAGNQVDAKTAYANALEWVHDHAVCPFQPRPA